VLAATDQDVARAACRRVGLRALPAPDSVEHVWDPASVCAIVSDGHELADALARKLIGRGWRVLVLNASDAGQVRDVPGIAAFIDIHGPLPATADVLSNTAEEARLKASFLLAKQLMPALTNPQLPCAWFFIVTHVDGKLGLDATPKTGGVVTAGAWALAKTLHHEWPSVFCRAVDLHPGLDADLAASLVIGELHDPDATLAEVGHGPDGRCTVDALEMVHD